MSRSVIATYVNTKQGCQHKFGFGIVLARIATRFSISELGFLTIFLCCNYSPIAFAPLSWLISIVSNGYPVYTTRGFSASPHQTMLVVSSFPLQCRTRAENLSINTITAKSVSSLPKSAIKMQAIINLNDLVSYTLLRANEVELNNHGPITKAQMTSMMCSKATGHFQGFATYVRFLPFLLSYTDNIAIS